MGSDFFESLVEGDFSGENAGLDAPVRLTKFEPFQTLAGLALGKPTFKLLFFVGLQQGETSAFQANKHALPRPILSLFISDSRSI